MIKVNWTKLNTRAKTVSPLYIMHIQCLNPHCIILLLTLLISLAASEIQNLRREAQAFKAVRSLLRSGCQNNGSTAAARRVFDKVTLNLFSFMLSPDTDLIPGFHSRRAEFAFNDRHVACSCPTRATQF